MAKKPQKKIKERSNASFILRIAKKNKTSGRGSAIRELDLVLAHLIDRLNCNMAIVGKYYDKSSNTIQPKVVAAALQAMLSGDLQTVAGDAGAAALLHFTNTKAEKASIKRSKQFKKLLDANLDGTASKE